jgi:threonine synthase
MWKAFDELQKLGLTGDKRPRIYCVQSSATTPLVRAFDQGHTDTEARDAGNTLAFGINVPGGIGHFKVLDIIRASGGKALAVDEDAILDSLSAVWQQKHWWICPEGAACIAALQPLLDSGDLKKGEKIVVINTGSAEKYLPEVQHLML